jgi:hypothetical protein
MNLKDVIKNSYKDKSKQKQIIGDYIRDDSLSGNRTQVYFNPKNNKSIVSHTGTNSLTDWLTDLQYANGNLEQTKRFKHAKRIQDEAEKKYGKENITTTGHSLGGAIARNTGKNTSHVYTVNSPTLPKEAVASWIWGDNKNQTDIRSKGDLVSIFAPFKRGEVIQIDSKSYNPLAEHKSDILDRLDEQIIFE